MRRGATEASSRKQGSSPSKSHSLLLILPQAQPKRKPSSQGMERVREGGTPLLSLGTDTHAHLSAASHRTFPITLFKKKREKKIHHPTQDSPPTRMGKMGYSTLGSGKNREQKKRLVWSSASWSGSPWPPLLPSTARSLYSPAVPRCFSAASSHQPRLRWAQGGMGR